MPDPSEATSGLSIRRWLADAIAGCLVGMLGLAFATMSWRLPASDEPGVPGPGTAPFLLGLLMAGCGLAVLITALAKRDEERVSFGGRKHLIALAALALGAVFFESGGFILVTFLFLAGEFMLLGEASLQRALPAAALVSVCLWLIFTKLLGVGLPYGRLVEILFR